MIYALPGTTFEATLGEAPEGLAGTVAIRVVDNVPDGAEVIARDTTGIVEAVPGTYVATRTLPTAVPSESLLVVWDLGDPLNEDETTSEELFTGGVFNGMSVLAAVESLMAARLREGGFSQAGGGQQVEHLTTGTKPTLARATEVANREAATIARAYPAATDADAAELTTVAALRAAIELEGSTFPEQVESNRSPARLWMDLLELRVSELNARLGSPSEAPAEPGGAALAAVWAFGGGADRAEGSECPQPVTCDGDTPRRLVW